tara:strand:+ start:264 stop:692 length:429 start_codon:yes stop_codon:yes gene_type:complete
LENNKDFILFLDELSDLKENKESEFIIRENKLIEIQNEINNSNNIFNENEINKKINQYNQQISFFKKDVEEFNLFINENLNYNRTIILKKIAEVAEIISINKNIDIIIESENYFISSENIDISQLIIKEINKNKIIFKIAEE